MSTDNKEEKMWAVGLLEITAGWEPRGHLGPLGAVGSSLPCGLSSLLYSFPPTWPAAQSHGPGAKRKVETCICGPDAMEVNNLLCLWGLFFYFTINSRLTPKSVTLVLPFSQTSEMSLEFFKWHLHFTPSSLCKLNMPNLTNIWPPLTQLSKPETRASPISSSSHSFCISNWSQARP